MLAAKKSTSMDAEDAGAIWIHETKDGKTALSIRIDGEKFIGLPVKKDINASDAGKQPDYYILRYLGEDDASNAEIVGSVWKRDDVDGRDIFSIHLGKDSASAPLIAVMLEKKVSTEKMSKRSPDMAIFRKTEDR